MSVMKREAPAAPDRTYTTISGRVVDQLYTPDRLASLDYARDLADPGQFPYTRGIHPTGYRGKLWTMRQFAGFGTPEETNDRYKTLLAAGATERSAPRRVAPEARVCVLTDADGNPFGLRGR